MSEKKKKTTKKKPSSEKSSKVEKSTPSKTSTNKSADKKSKRPPRPPRSKMPEQPPEVRIKNFDEVPYGLDPEQAKSSSIDEIKLDEKTYRFRLNENAMAVEKLSEGIRKFSADIVKLEKFIEEKM